MNAQSAATPTKGKAGVQNRLTLDGAAPSVSAPLSSTSESVTRLANELKLTVDLQIRSNEQWLEMTLEDEMNLGEVKVTYPVMCTTLNRGYHLREALVIGLRRLVQSAFDQQMISDYPGELMTVWKSPPESAIPMPTSLAESMPSLTDLDSL